MPDCLQQSGFIECICAISPIWPSVFVPSLPFSGAKIYGGTSVRGGRGEDSFFTPHCIFWSLRAVHVVQPGHKQSGYVARRVVHRGTNTQAPERSDERPGTNTNVGQNQFVQSGTDWIVSVKVGIFAGTDLAQSKKFLMLPGTDLIVPTPSNNHVRHKPE